MYGGDVQLPNNDPLALVLYLYRISQQHQAYLYRQGLWNGAYFGVIGLVRETWTPPAPPAAAAATAAAVDQRGREGGGGGGRMMYDFSTGLTAGSLATVVNTPLDLAKTRITCMRGAVPWCLPFLLSIYREEGFRACFKGLAARLYRAAPGSGVLLVGYEWIKHWLVAA
jgi:solute carrier family 25 (mitochondrial 2-oxodicarboxylate transporter), member 21